MRRCQVAGRVIRRTVMLLAGCAVLLAACTGPQPQAGSRQTARRGAPSASSLLGAPARLVDRPVASTGCRHRPAVQPGTTGLVRVAVPPSAAAGARQRIFWLHVPADYDLGRPVPLVLAFHGGNGTGLGMQQGSELSVLADQHGFLAAYPQGLAQPDGKGTTGWDASGPADPFAKGINDGLFVSDVLNAVQARYCVDPWRIVATGLSNGGSMTGYLACVLAGRIAAFVPVEGVFFQIAGGCHPAHPAAILDVHVLTDPVAPYAGVPSRGSPDYYAPSVPAWLAGWAARDRCRAGPRLFSGPSAIGVASWSGCPGGVTVTGYRLATGGHSWFKEIGAMAGDRLILAFLAAHPLRPAPPGWAPGPPAGPPELAAPRIPVRAVRQFPLPLPSAEPFDIAPGPAGSMWFTEFRADKIGRITPSGKITQYPVPTPDAGPYQITAGPGGAAWFTEYNTTKIGSISASGRVAETALPHPSFGGAGITGGAHGMLWVADAAGYADRFIPGGGLTRTRLFATRGAPFAITTVAGGPVYVSTFTGFFEHGPVLLRISPGRLVTTVLRLPSPLANIDALAAGPSGAVWFTDFGTSHIGELLPGGKLLLFRDPSPDAGLSDITRGPDGAMWYTDQSGLIGRITPAGAISQLALPDAGSNPNGIAAGPGRTIWITDTGTGTITRITLRPLSRRRR